MLGGGQGKGTMGPLNPPTVPVLLKLDGHGCRRPRPLWRQGDGTQSRLSSHVFCCPCPVVRVPRATVQIGGGEAFQAGCLCPCFVCPFGETIRDTFLSTLWTRPGSLSRPMASGHLRALWGEGGAGSCPCSLCTPLQALHLVLAVLPGRILNCDQCLFPRGVMGSPSMPSDQRQAWPSAGDGFRLRGERWKRWQVPTSRRPAGLMGVRREMAWEPAAQRPSSGPCPWSCRIQDDRQCSV